LNNNDAVKTKKLNIKTFDRYLKTPISHKFTGINVFFFTYINKRCGIAYRNR